jgi:UDP-N-acetylglucosamine diphosphorylase / glucose-1-phosphate thymidylyltransferase / UDP-N-acetylgalactosamine diphosphorylase / glucosamine-1-phosphate N-acetyltransferase / galactosamine-1-phosphate N-acetyltransferase
MPTPDLILFDDAAAQAWEPFALTRPAGELLFGTLTLRARSERALGIRCVAHLAADHLAGFEEAGAPPVRRFADAPASGDRLFLLSRVVVERGDSNQLVGRLKEPGPVQIDGQTAGWFAPDGTPAPSADFFRNPAVADPPSGGGGAISLAGRLLERVWQLISENPEQIARDIAKRFPDPAPPSLPAGVHRLGDGAVVLGEGVQIEPGVVLDTRGGPIWLDADVQVRAFTRLAGPAYVGPGSSILGGPVETVSIGPVCKVRGELAESICLGYSNKQHDGHMGHAYLGRWVNLGAETTNSDLKNNYGTIRIWTPDGDTDTGVIKLGCLLGDHVKTGIGLLFNTGTVVGAGSNLFGAAMPPKFVPPFSWGSGSELTEYRVDKFLEVAERALGRRGVKLSAGMRGVLEAAWKRSRSEDGEGE